MDFRYYTIGHCVIDVITKYDFDDDDDDVFGHHSSIFFSFYHIRLICRTLFSDNKFDE